MKEIHLVATAIALFFSALGWGQSTEFKTTRNLGFSESNKIQTVDIKIAEKTVRLSLEIICSVKEGSVTIEIFNPSGEKQGEFSVESTESEKDESLFSLLKDGVSGQINKRIIEPALGKWTIKFTPENASGRVNIQSIQLME